MYTTSKYDFSFTASSLRLNEMVMIAEAQLNNKDFDYVNILGKGKSATGKRHYSELKKRLSYLTEKQLQFFVAADTSSQKQLAFLAVCKSYGFIRDFVVDVLREKYLVFDYDITEGDYNTFLRRTSDLHTEIEGFTETTIQKLRQVVFKILEQVGFIDSVKRKQIVPQFLDNKLIDLIVEDNIAWLKIYLLSDMDINALRK
jgi:ribosomal protein S8